MKHCKGCKYWDSFSWACGNGDSPYCADFVNKGCREYDRCRKDDATNDGNGSRSQGTDTNTNG